VVVQFELGRMILSQMMTVYVPTLLIMTVSYLTTFFNNRQWFGHIITINLTVPVLLLQIDSSEVVTKVGGPLISSENRKSSNLRT
jgi:hypothetical protein